MLVEWTPNRFEVIGYLGQMLDDENPAPAREQFNEAYAHGGGWQPFEGFKMSDDGNTITYPGDPPYSCIARARLRDERIFLYPHGWVAIVQPDNSYEISRMD